MKSLSFKLILRSWWRNKTFAIISILSLAVGIACTNLLIAFVLHEYHVEASNPNKDKIYSILQDSPMQSDKKVFYAVGNVPPMLKDHYPEVEDFLCVGTADISEIEIGETLYEPIDILITGSAFATFFPCKTISGNLEEALTEPNKIALTEQTAVRFFGKDNPIGKTITTKYKSAEAEWGEAATDEKTTYQVVAIIKPYDQTILSFDGLCYQAPNHYGGTYFLLMNGTIEPETFALRVKKDGVPCMRGDDGRYYFYSLQETYFQDFKAQTLPHLKHQDKTNLSIGLCSAFLILLIACFNYVNLNFSRLLQQLKMIRIQRLMGASRVAINKQLFFDIFLTVIIGFLLSLLIMYDLVPVFNSILGGHMSISYIFSLQVVPFLIALVLILSIIPAIYVSRKIVSLSHQQNYALFREEGKQGIIAALSVIQFAISIALIIATLTINRQTALIRKGGEAYQELIEVGPPGGYGNMKPLITELHTHPELGEISISEGSVLHSPIRQIVVPDSSGNNFYFSLLRFKGNPDYFSTFHICLKQGFQPQEAIKNYARPVYINQRFADLLVTKGNNPTGQPLKSFDKDFDSQNKEDGSKENPITTIAGVVDNFFTNSLEEEISPAIINIHNDINENYAYVYFRLDEKHPERLNTVKQLWEKLYPDKLFVYRNVYQDFISRNRKAFGLVELLLVYSLISILLTSFGLFGVALYSTEQRTKEIGIRKINGATTLQIIKLLNRRFILWIGIAFLIASPVTWILLNRWLQNFVFRTDISAEIFLIALLVVSAISLFTVSWHSYKAASGNPVNALRDE
ncbi:MAG: ABC transporter permease [Massilibacteroides sp.]|nr:ABC transporter permease [Massilibacteroides sp.]MDD3062279.1 ABC transporter permease [Massilibacteroides sp.]MDD4113982.1 ABC transporter permease [Massilibacteroides sp.]MDD4660052.1 ABC transporter permease [Massilibacteroides sp.]